MSEHHGESKLPGELDSPSEDPDQKTQESLYAYDPLSSLTLDYVSHETIAEKDEFVSNLRRTLTIPEVSEESKKDIIRFLKKLEKGALDN